METAILINLDYQHAPYDECRQIWEKIRHNMVAAGFKFNGRLFTIDLPQEREAFMRARKAVESIEEHLDFEDRHLHRYLKDFYGFRYENLRDMLPPCPADIEVRELAHADMA